MEQALIAAHRKWGSTVEYPYRAEALRLLDAMGDPDKRFFTRDGKVRGTEWVDGMVDGWMDGWMDG